MKATFKVNNDLTFEVEEKSMNEVFEQLAEIRDVFGTKVCGKCKKENTKFSVRDIEGSKFYEQHCTECHARLIFGLHVKGGKLYPKTRWGSLSPGEQVTRTDEKKFADQHNGWLPNAGWYNYTPVKKD